MLLISYVAKGAKIKNTIFPNGKIWAFSFFEKLVGLAGHKIPKWKNLVFGSVSHAKILLAIVRGLGCDILHGFLRMYACM